MKLSRTCSSLILLSETLFLLEISLPHGLNDEHEDGGVTKTCVMGSLRASQSKSPAPTSWMRSTCGP